ncbi:hypothetical protein ACIGXM_14895 [Kitasatospora sp. NPDC052896]|uniref:hypothetical protein n=1 Tax=Kitasatospora sp. NPDC052896 TaxID=3364061 RepID=UPI0037C540F1
MKRAVPFLPTRAALGAVSVCALAAVLPMAVTATQGGATHAAALVTTSNGAPTQYGSGGAEIKEWNSTGS